MQTDSLRWIRIHEILLVGNKVTKPSIILRELTFTKGDSIQLIDIDKQFQRSRQNLLNTSLFNFVVIEKELVDSNQINVVVSVSERWYTFPVPLFEIAERNFNVWWETKNFDRASYGFYLVRENFRGRKETVMLKARFGYAEQYGISYQVPFINKKQNVGMGANFYYNRAHEVAYGSIGNRLMFYKDENRYMREELSSRISFTYRPKLYNSHFLNLRFSSGNVADTITKITTDYYSNNKRYMEYLAADYGFKHDYRDSKVYPLKGHYFAFEVSKIGMGILDRESVDVTTLFASAKKYFPHLFGVDRLYVATGIKGKVSSTSNIPYTVQRGLGYGDYVRGYEYYVVDGQKYFVGQAAIRWELVKPRVKKINSFKVEKFSKFHYAFYAGIYGDAGYVGDKKTFMLNSLSNSWIYGGGVNIDFVTYYDTVIRFEYSINKQGEHGFFLHFTAPI